MLSSYGAFEKEGNINIALEFMDAGSLAHVLKKVGQISEPIIGMITGQILQGLSYLHKMHVVHRDIKPANILLNKNGVVKLADFGVSGQTETSMDCLTSWVGTMSYMSPERLSGNNYFKDTDLWSVGIILIECATGRCPMPETGFWDLLANLTNKAPPSLPDSFSAEFRDFVNICLRPQGGTRSSAQELLSHPFVTNYSSLDRKLLKKWIRAV